MKSGKLNSAIRGVALACTPLLAFSSVLPAVAAPSGSRPNIIIILTDDQGYGDAPDNKYFDPVVKQLSAAYDPWWADVLPHLVNEDAYKSAPEINPFKQDYRNQFGGVPQRSTRGK